MPTNNDTPDERELAINFAREVIGWSDPAFVMHVIINRAALQPLAYRFAPGMYEDVALHIANWCDENDASFDTEFNRMTWKTIATITRSSNPLSPSQAERPDTKIALMEACLKAERDRQQERTR